ncbi:MAG: hypothetical protein ACI9OH_003274 [Oleispira sp.]|jgi:hypothetical protein
MEDNTNSKTNIIKENDLVLSLPEDMINFQFKKLCDQQKLAGKEKIAKWDVITKYGLELHAHIEPPTIRILEGKRDTIQLRIKIIKGNMVFWEGFGPDAIKHETSVNGFVYVFDSEIGSIPTKYSEMDTENVDIISKDVREQITEKVDDTKKFVNLTKENDDNPDECKPLSDENFTIESILMDFQKSNIANFNEEESEIDLEGEALVQL